MVHHLQILKTHKMHFLKQIVFEKASNHYFSAGNGVLKNDRFCALFLGGGGETLIGRKLCPLVSHSLDRERKKKKKTKKKLKQLLSCCFGCFCCCCVVVVVIVVVVVVALIVVVLVVVVILEGVLL